MKVVVYSKANCPGCVSLKARLNQAKIDFQEVRIDLDIEQAKWLVSQGHRSVPLVYKDGVHLKNVEELF